MALVAARGLQVGGEPRDPLAGHGVPVAGVVDGGRVALPPFVRIRGRALGAVECAAALGPLRVPAPGVGGHRVGRRLLGRGARRGHRHGSGFALRPEPGVAQGAGQPAGLQLPGHVRLGQRGLQDPVQLAELPVGGGRARLLGEPARLARHRRHRPVALRGQRPQLCPVQGPLGLRQAGRHRDEPVELVGPVAGEEVGQPRRAGRPAQATDGPGEVPVAALPGRGHVIVAGGDEVLGRQRVEGVGDGVQLVRHDDDPRP
ncbi:MAG: hypothetical protein ACT4RN_10220 [Pseudonocardia sp.]